MKQNKILYTILTWIVRPILWVFFPYEVYGKENIKNLNCGHILCPNHLSNLDPIILAVVYPRKICFMGKSELFKNKFFAGFLNAIGVFAVKRGKNDGRAIEEAENILKSGKVLGIFIEGTRSKTGEFLRPKSGAAVLAHKNNTKIVPVCITGGGKNNKIHIFKKTIIKFNTPINPEELGIRENSRLEIKSATNLIMSKIKEMRD